MNGALNDFWVRKKTIPYERTHSKAFFVDKDIESESHWVKKIEREKEEWALCEKAYSFPNALFSPQSLPYK